MRSILTSVMLLLVFPASATIFGSVRGVIHDPQHRPVQGAMVMVKAKSSEWSQTTTTNSNGEFEFQTVPLGEYIVSVASSGFIQTAQDVVVISGTQPVVHFQLKVLAKSETVNVSAAPEVVPTDTATPTTLISRENIERTPGADRTNSMAMITDYVPGAYVVHDMLHIRGGHQTTWLVDGVPVPNTNIAADIGPQFDPKDIDYLEINRGSYGAEFGDRTYGVFNVAPRTGFERNNEAELIMSFGNFHQTNDSLSFGSHTERFAYYASLNGNRSNLGLQPPVPQVVHDAANGYGGFGTLIFNVDPSNQLRLVTSLRRDYYQVPYDPFPNDIENGSIAANGFTPQYPSIGLRDGEHESDAILNVSWVHTFNSNVSATFSPLFHYNSGDYNSRPTDVPVATTQDRASTYVGGQGSLSANFARNNLQTGFFSFYQHDRELFGAIFNDGSGNAPISDIQHPTGNQETFFVDDKFTPFPWLTLIAGMRPTRFSGEISESAISPRFGATVTIPKIRWTFRGFYGHYYQAPPLLTVSGPALINFAQGQGLGFVPLHGEFDEEHQFGVAIPFRGWVLDADNFRTNARNFFDHNNIGDSSIFFPITVSRAVIRGWELTLRSPRFAHRAQIHLAYSNQIAEASGTITGGLTDFSFSPELSPLDHDQRNTLNVGGDVSLPWRSYAATNINYGSGFTNGFPGQPYPGDYLPAHTTFDLSLGKDFGERISASLNLLNVTNRRVELDNSLTFGGFHWDNPREIYVQFRYRFHY
ncbi:MAG: TonB-dependent receptor [Acidobacteriaceae bacterium]|nr:TonB-dependent receptor [Acidobacteriaceae bacterium]